MLDTVVNIITGGALFFVIAIVLGIAAVLGVVLAMAFRQVVKTNEVHVVQARKKTTPYGVGQTAGNVYYKWPSWVPYFGLTVIPLPISNFDLNLVSYEAYDKDRVPFVVDVTAFFRVSDPARAAQRVESMSELYDQLEQIVKGAVRKVLASDVIDEIMLERAKFGKLFTGEIEEQLKEWGVENVKAMELMDIRDSKDTKNIQNIMAKKTSFIEKESRTEVANNMRAAQEAEIDAARSVAVRQQEADQTVGQRTAETQKQIGIANQQSQQEVLTQERETRERAMEVQRVNEVRSAEIEKQKQIVAAEQDKQTRIIKAEGDKQQQIVKAEGEQQSTVIQAEGDLQAEKKRAIGIEAVGEAEGKAKTAIEMAVVNPQIALAREIGSNEGYQKYLVSIEQIKATIEVGVANAKALTDADVKVIANAGGAPEGLTSVGDLFNSKGGTQIGAMLEGLLQTDAGAALADQLGIKPKTQASVKPKKNGGPQIVA